MVDGCTKIKCLQLIDIDRMASWISFLPGPWLDPDKLSRSVLAPSNRAKRITDLTTHQCNVILPTLVLASWPSSAAARGWTEVTSWSGTFARNWRLQPTCTGETLAAALEDDEEVNSAEEGSSIANLEPSNHYIRPSPISWTIIYKTSTCMYWYDNNAIGIDWAWCYEHKCKSVASRCFLFLPHN